MRLLKKFFKKKDAENIVAVEEKEAVPNLCTVYLEDKYYDTMIDNDDIEDEPTIIKVVYDKDSGKILSREGPCAINREYCHGSTYKYRGDKEYHSESQWKDILAFYHCCGIDKFHGMELYKQYTVWKLPTQNKFSNIVQARHNLKEYCKNNNIKTYF